MKPIESHVSHPAPSFPAIPGDGGRVWGVSAVVILILLSSPFRHDPIHFLVWTLVLVGMVLGTRTIALAAFLGAGLLFAVVKPRGSPVSLADVIIVVASVRIFLGQRLPLLGDWKMEASRERVLFFGLVLLGSLSCIGVAASGGDLGTAVKVTLRFAEYFLAYRCLEWYLSGKDTFRQFERVFLALAVIVGALGIAQFLLGPTFCGANLDWGPWWTDAYDEEGFRVYSVFTNPIYLAAYCSFFIPWLFHEVLTNKQRRLPHLGALLIIGMCMLLTFSRTGLVGALAGLVYVARVELRKVLLIGVLVASLLLFAPLTLMDRVTNMDPGALLNTYGRILAAQEAAQMIWDSPLTGIGIGQYPAHLMTLIPREVSEQELDSLTAENTLLQFGAELGLAGLMFCFFLVRAVASNCRRMLAAGNQYRGFVGGLLAVLVTNFFASMTAVSMVLFFLSLVAATNAYAQAAARESEV